MNFEVLTTGGEPDKVSASARCTVGDLRSAPRLALPVCLTFASECNQMGAEAKSLRRPMDHSPALSRERTRARDARYRATHPDRVRAKNAKYRAANSERVRACQRKFRATHPDSARTASAKYRATHPELVREIAAKYRAEHPDRLRLYTAAYKARHPERRRASLARYRAANPEKVRAWKNASAARNPETVLAKGARRRARKKDATGSGVSRIEWRNLLRGSLGLCAYCFKRKKLSMDHIVPLARGGEHDVANIAAVCVSCNGSKGVQPLLVWLARRRGELVEVT